MANNTGVHNHEEKLRNIIHSNRHIHDLIRWNVNAFINLRERLLTNSGIQHLAAFNDLLAPLIQESLIEQLNACITSNKVQLAFCGENSSGKTAFLHTFLGIGKILPSGDGPVTARITKLTYASGEQARICVWKTLRDQTLIEEDKLSTFFASEKPNWMGLARALSKHLKRPQGMDDTSAEFADWARCFVEIHVPSPTLALGIDVYDTPGFLLDDAQVLKDILHDLVELIHPTIIFLYANPSTDDATKGCFLAMKTALYDLDTTSIFFLNSKADINQMPRFKPSMDVHEFISALADERAQRYNLLLRAPFLANEKLEGLPSSVDECRCFDLCSVNSQPIKPYGPLMNENTIQRIIQFVANNDLAVATRICKLILPIIDAFFNLLLVTSYRTSKQLLQLHDYAMHWEEKYFQAHTIYTEKFLKDLLTNIFQRFNTEEEAIVQPFLNIHRPTKHLERSVQTAARLQVITPAIRHTLRNFMHDVFEHITSDHDLTESTIFNEILIHAIGRQDISDFAVLLLGDHNNKRTVDSSILYMVNTLSTPILQCAHNLQSLDFSNETGKIIFSEAHQELFKDQNQSCQQQLNSIIRKHLLNMQAVIAKEQDTMQQAVRLWVDQQQAVLRSLIDVYYKTTSPLLNSHQETLKHLEQYIRDFILIECELRAAQDIAKFSGNKLEIRNGDSKSTMFSLFTADWGNEKNLIVKKLSEPLPDQPYAAFYEAHYHLKVARLRHRNIIDFRYLYQHQVDNETSELWIIFPPIIYTLEQFLQRSSTSISIQTVIMWMSGIADALTILHRDELVHRNVVLSNIVLTEDKHAMLVDLGNWHENCDLSVRHNPSSTLNGTNDDMKGFGEIGLSLRNFIEQNEKVSIIVDEFNDLMLRCSQASPEEPITAEFAREKLKFLLDML